MAWRQFVLAGRQVSLAPGVSLNFESLPNRFDVWFYATDNGSPPAADLFVLTVNIGGACPTQSLIVSPSPLTIAPQVIMMVVDVQLEVVVLADRPLQT